jgi:cytochrome P450
MPLTFDLFAPEVLADPYPLYRAVRAEAAVWRGPQGQWLLTRYGDVVAALHDPRLSSATLGDLGRANDFPEPLQAAVRAMMRPLQTFMVSQDPPEHTRLRGLVNKALTPHAVQAMLPMIQARVDTLVDVVVARTDPATGTGRCDIISDFAFRLPVTIVGVLLGLPEADHDRFREWAFDLSVLWGPTNVPDVEERVRRCEASVAALAALFERIIGERRAAPGSDLISGMIAAAAHGIRLTDEELIWNCVLMLLAGHETVTDLIGNGLLALMRFPEQWRKLRSNPALVPDAVDELLRYDAPFQFMQRAAREDLEIAGTKIAAGERLWLMLGAANRDPDVFPDPDRLDVTRTHSHQIAFGQGIHFCPGAPLARIEGQIAFTALVRRFAELRLATDRLVWLPKLPNRGLQALPVSFQV